MLAFSIASVPVTLTHSVEDFAYGVHEKFGLALLPAALALSLGYAAQMLAAILAAQGRRAGYWPNLGIALVWLVAAVADHLGEVLLAWP